MAKGKLFPEYWIDCGICHNEKCMGERTAATAAQTAKAAGWVKTKALGWVCPSDAAEAKCPPKYKKSRDLHARETAKMGQG